jgi:hypothetical protein
VDSRAKLQRMMRREFGHLKNSARVKVVTVTAVDYTTNLATIQLAQGDPADDPPDPQDVGWTQGYVPIVGDQAYMIIAEGSPVLIGAKDIETWHAMALTGGFSFPVGSYGSPQYKRTLDARVVIRGGANIAANSAVGTKFNFPVGYRPQYATAPLAAPMSNGTSVVAMLRLDVGISGNVNTLAISPAATQFILLEGLSFDLRP